MKYIFILCLLVFNSSFIVASDIANENAETSSKNVSHWFKPANLPSLSSGLYHVSPTENPWLGFLFGVRPTGANQKLDYFWYADLNKNVSEQSTVGVFYGTSSTYKNLLGLRYTTQVFQNTTENLGLKARFSFFYFDFENTGAFASVGNVLYGKQIDKLMLFSGLRFPVTHWTTQPNYRLESEGLFTYGYFGAEYKLWSFLGVYTDYYKNKLSLGLSIHNMPIVISLGPDTEVRIGHPFYVF